MKREATYTLDRNEIAQAILRHLDELTADESEVQFSIDQSGRVDGAVVQVVDEPLKNATIMGGCSSPLSDQHPTLPFNSGSLSGLPSSR